MTSKGPSHPARAKRSRDTWSRVWQVLSYQWPRKLGSLAFASVVWFVATTDRRTALERTFEVPLQIIDRSTDAQSRLVLGLPRTVRVTLSGSRARLESLLPERIEADVNVTDSEEGGFETRVEVRTPAETDLKRLEPTLVSGLIDATISQSFAVEPQVSSQGETPFVQLKVTPSRVTVRGSRRQVDKVVRVVTVPGPVPVPVPVPASGPGLLEGGNPERPGEVYLLAVARSGGIVTGVQFSPSRVTLERSEAPGTVGLGVSVKTVPVKLAPLDPAWEASEVSFKPARVRLVGPTNLLEDLTALEVRFPLQAGPSSVTALPVLPPGVAVLERIQVTLSLRKKG